MKSDWLEMDASKNTFLFTNDRKRCTGRKDAEAYLVSQYNVSPKEAKRIIDQGAPQGGYNLAGIIGEEN